MNDRLPEKTLREIVADWERNVLEPYLRKFPEQREFVTSSGIAVKPIYTAADLEGFDPREHLGLPGSYPFTRGVTPNMYRSQLWVMSQYAGYGSAADANRRYKYLLSQGHNGFGIAFDLPTQLGYDSDHPLAAGQVGQIGVAIDTLEDVSALLDGIPIEKLQIRVVANAHAAVILAMLIAEAQRRGVATDRLRLIFQNDVLKEFTSRGNYIFPPAPSLRLFADVFEYCTNNMPDSKPVYFCGYHVREAGANAVQEVAFNFANAIAYIEAALARGLSVDVFGPKLLFFWSSHRNFFEEVAKLRAARRLWTRIVKERFRATNAEACKMPFFVGTAGSTLTAQEPYNNIARVTLQGLAGVLGGAQIVHLSSMDEAFSIPSEHAVQIAARTQQILAYETGVIDTADPLGGSYYVEYLTNKIEEEISNYLKRIDDMGGAMRAIEGGYIQREIRESAYRYQKAVEDGREVVIGVNKFQATEEIDPPAFEMDRGVEQKQNERLREFKNRRDALRSKRWLERIEEVARGQGNTIPVLIDAVKNDVTLGEIHGVLRQVFGSQE